MLNLVRREGLIDAYEQRPIGRMIRAGLLSELKAVRHVLRPLPSGRFMIFAQGRTGSTLLTTTLDVHPQITCKDEILGLPRAAPIHFIGNLARASSSPYFGFHAKIYQLTSWQRVQNVHEWLTLIQRRGWKIIYLRRENLLRHVVSNIFAETSGAYHHRIGEATARADLITVPPRRLRSSIEGRRLNLTAEREALSGLDYLELVYERDLERPVCHKDTFERIQSYLGVESVTLDPPLTKAVGKPLDQLIKNFDEVKSVLSGTPDELYLHS